MQRYFLEVSYYGAAYSGFQVQENANSVQEEVEKAIKILQKQPITLTGSSRTDTGVHALQNYFHFDYDGEINKHFLYKLNAILPRDIVLQKLSPVAADAHCRFDAISRSYKYFVYRHKNPFVQDRAYYYPYKLDFSILQEAASIIKTYSDFTSFAKRNTQVKTFECRIHESEWLKENDCLVYAVKSNRFLRGMVRGLTGTMLKVATGKLSIENFKAIIEAKNNSQADFSVPGHGLFLINVEYPFPL